MSSIQGLGQSGMSALQGMMSTPQRRPPMRPESAEAGASPSAPTGSAPPGPPPEFDVQMSTTQFAGSCGMQGAGGPPPMGPPPGGDPVDSLDTDADGLVSAHEFGIDESSSDEMKALFSAMDSDGDGSLTLDERHDFRDRMMEAIQSSEDGPSLLAPPSRGETSSSFLARLAPAYATLFSSTGTSAEKQAEGVDLTV